MRLFPEVIGRGDRQTEERETCPIGWHSPNRLGLQMEQKAEEGENRKLDSS